MSTEFMQVLPDKPTGTAEVELDMEGKPTFRIVRSVAYDFVDLTDQELKRIAEIQPDWIYSARCSTCRRKPWPRPRSC